MFKVEKIKSWKIKNKDITVKLDNSCEKKKEV